MYAVLVAIAVLAAGPLPVPTAADLARAQTDIQEVFGADLAKARKPADRIVVARRMIETAAESRPAARYALLNQARELAIAARDSAVGVRAVAELVAGFAPEKPRDIAQWAADGHRLWNDAGGKRWPGALLKRLQAAECYLRALDRLEGFQKRAVEKRLRDLGWPAKRFLSPKQVVDLFGIPGARIEGDTVRWKDVSGPAALWTRRPIGQQPLEFGFEIQAKHNHLIRADIDGAAYVLSVGHYSNAYTLFATTAGGPATFERVASTRVDSPDKWHALAVRLDNRKVRFFYDNELIHEVNQKQGAGLKSKIRVGFGDHGTDVSIRRVYFVPLDRP